VARLALRILVGLLQRVLIKGMLLMGIKTKDSSRLMPEEVLRKNKKGRCDLKRRLKNSS